jgi:ATP-dependent helicase/nuclease subunit B
MGDPNVRSIPSGTPFIPNLVEALLDGRLIEGFAPRVDPLALSRATIWVPTRRAVRALNTSFSTALEGRAALLPQIRALGDAESDDPFAEASRDAFALLAGPSAAIGDVDCTLLLARLVEAWTGRLKERQKALFSQADIIVPANSADAVGLARQLGALMDSMATEERPWEALEGLAAEAGEDLQDWWKLTLQFLTIATATVPQVLSERGLVDPAVQRVAALRAQAQIYRQNGSSGPVIAAGSTGSIPATADLLDAIARLDQGCVVLPGLDRDLEDEIFTKIDLPDNDRNDMGTAGTHPQYGLGKLLRALKIDRAQVHHIGALEHDRPLRLREKIVSEAMRPADTTDRWPHFQAAVAEHQRIAALDGVALVEAPGEREEAMAIALALRDTLETEGATCALVTPDRNLARRVATDMRRFGVRVDDSAGLPLDNRMAGTFARLVVRQAFGIADPNVTVALIKHPLARFGMDARQVRWAANGLEIAGLRGAVEPVENGRHFERIHEAMLASRTDRHRHQAVARFNEDDWACAVGLAEKLDEIFGAGSGGVANVADLATRSLALIEACAADGEGGISHLTERLSGDVLMRFLDELMGAREDWQIAPGHWPDVFEQLMTGRPVRPTAGTHPRIMILGPLEARLQHFDRVVLGGLNEGTWPGGGGNDPFLSRPMKGDLGLPTPERRIGLAAHDVAQALGHRDVVLTRAVLASNAPTVASRWVQRLTTVAGEQAADAMKAAGAKFVDWAEALEVPAEAVPPVAQPNPKPPLDKRPRRLSVTAIPTLVADPYAIYARHVLRLQKLPPLMRAADHRERGILFHRVVEDFVALGGGREDFVALARGLFDEDMRPDEVLARWWPRMVQIAEDFVAWHGELAPDIQKTFAELHGEVALGDDFTLSGVADRFDRRTDGSFALWDYKTTGGPPIGQVKDGRRPQLPLLTAMAGRGGFEEVDKPVERFGYVHLVGGDFAVQSLPDGKDDGDPQAIAALCWAQLERLVARYRDAENGYLSKARYIEDELYEGDYDHLARVAEWSVMADSGDGEGGE